ncbi:MAG TPA: hypothetical protein PLO37_26170 [Candidatus Hydrogenedentes bacterium]|nr:hypothetical protein [Candidatus Hydrogenedentota bacterium]
MLNPLCLLAVLVAVMAISFAAPAQNAPQDFTCFQTGSDYGPEIDIGSDVAVVYGVNASFPDRVALWREKGYVVSMMTGIAWGGYDDYYGSGDAFRRDEVQTDKTGKLWMHGNSTTVGYNVPTPSYVEYIKRVVDPAIDAGVRAIYLEEPEYWAVTGWSEAFKAEWQRAYNEPWQAPDSSPDAQYRASKLKYELYFNALKEVFEHVKRRAADKGIEIECHVPTHSLINYAQWRIVSPESHLMDLDAMDGYVAQVWTGTARSANVYGGKMKERTFETAFLEYGQALGMVRPTGRKVWFLADPVEDNPDRSWNDYKRNYECTVIASLMWPEVHHFEVMPWPSRIFRGTYPRVDLDSASGDREGIPADYATQILTVINALNEMDQADVRYETGSRGVGVVVSDTLMFQRADPEPSDAHLSSFYGLALPLVKHGVPVEIVQLENTLQPRCLESCKVLLLTYEGQKPLKPAYHEALAEWVRAGGGLIYVGDGSDPYHRVREWWTDDGNDPETKAYDDLFERLGVADGQSTGCFSLTDACEVPVKVGNGYVRILQERPRDLARAQDGPATVIGLVAEMFECLGEKLTTQNHLVVRRGPFVVASVLDESVSDAPLRLDGAFVNLFESGVPVRQAVALGPGERALLYDIDYARRNGVRAKVVAAGARVRDERVEERSFHFVTRGPKATTANLRVLLPEAPERMSLSPETPLQSAWDAESGTLLMSFGNSAQDVAVDIEW